jgi:hypothetical protein
MTHLQNYQDQLSAEFRLFQWGLAEGWSRLTEREQRSAAFHFCNLIEDVLRDIEQTPEAKKWSISSRLAWLADQAEKVENGGYVYREKQ